MIAKGYMEKDPSMSYADAVAKAWENTRIFWQSMTEKQDFKEGGYTDGKEF